MERFFPLDTLQLIAGHAAEAGTVLVARTDGRGPFLVAELNDTRVLVPLELGGSGFRVEVPGRDSEARYLQVSEATFSVDHEDLLSPFSGHPRPGSLFISSGRLGLIATWNSATVYVGLDGAQLPEPTWSEFVAFPTWRLIAPAGGDEVVTLFESKPKLVSDGDV
jgi:hypothetical protein